MLQGNGIEAQPRSRRQFLTGGVALLAVLAAACAPAPAAPTAAPAAPAPAPTSPQPTATTAPAAPAAAPTATTAAAPTAAPPTPTTAAPTATPAAQAAPQAASGAAVVPVFASDNAELPFDKSAIAQFQKDHPNVPVNAIYVPGSEFDQKTDLLIAGGTAPSLFYPAATRSYRYYATKNLIQNLDSLISRDKYATDDFSTSILSACKWGGSLYALPRSSSPWVLYYNKTLFDQAKVPYPPTDWNDASWTWDKYLETAKALTITNNGKTTQYGGGLQFLVIAIGWLFGGWWYNHDWVDTGWITKFLAPSDPLIAQALQFWADGMNKYHIIPTASEAHSLQAGLADLFLTGHVGMWMKDAVVLSVYAGIKDFEWGIATWPHAAGQPHPMHHGDWYDSWSMFKDTPNQDGSWELLKYMASPDGERGVAIASGRLGARKSLGDEWMTQWKTKVPKQADQLGVVVGAQAFDWPTPDNFSVNFSPVNDKVQSPIIQKTLLGQGTAADNIKAAQADADAAIADSLKTMGYTG
jgi:multiple sugar transport system substrate-binding protein